MNKVLTHQLSQVNLQIVVAMDAAGGIGYEGKLPWPKNAKDFAHFKQLTEGGQVIMGRKTYEEIEEINNSRENPCKTLLSNRECIVLSKENILSQSNIFVENSLLNAVQYFNNESKGMFVIGGLQLFTEALPWVNTIHATVFSEEYKCDKYLPLNYIMKHFDIVNGSREEGMDFITMQRVR